MLSFKSLIAALAVIEFAVASQDFNKEVVSALNSYEDTGRSLTHDAVYLALVAKKNAADAEVGKLGKEREFE